MEPIDLSQRYTHNLMKEARPFQQIVLEQLDIHRGKNELQPKSYTLYKN